MINGETKEEKRTAKEILDYAANDYYADCSASEILDDLTERARIMAALKQAVYGNVDGALSILNDETGSMNENIDSATILLEEGMEILKAYIDEMEK